MLAMTAVIVDYTLYVIIYILKCVSNFLYSTGRAPKRRGARGNLPLYSLFRMDWVH